MFWFSPWGQPKQRDDKLQSRNTSWMCIKSKSQLCIQEKQEIDQTQKYRKSLVLPDYCGQNTLLLIQGPSGWCPQRNLRLKWFTNKVHSAIQIMLLRWTSFEKNKSIIVVLWENGQRVWVPNMRSQVRSSKLLTWKFFQMD